MIHEEYKLERTGAKWYVVDSDGNKLSDGYHEITVKGHGNFEGKLGAKTEEFSVDNK